MTDALRLAGATKPCLSCKGTGEQSHFPTHQMEEVMVCDCVDERPGFGRVHVFPDATGVRVACGPCDGTGKQPGVYGLIDAPDMHCDGRGWNAATEGWAEQTSELNFHRVEEGWIGYLYLDSRHGDTTREDACPTFKAAVLLALTRAVEAHEGWQLMEVKDA